MPSRRSFFRRFTGVGEELLHRTLGGDLKATKRGGDVVARRLPTDEEKLAAEGGTVVDDTVQADREFDGKALFRRFDIHAKQLLDARQPIA